MNKALVLCEKPSVALDMARVMGFKIKGDGYVESGEYVFTWAYGHLYGLAMPEDYNEEDKAFNIDRLPIIPDEFMYVQQRTDDKRINGHIKILKELMKRKDITCIINACDTGREGELIFRLIYTKLGNNKKMLRHWTNSLEDEEIRRGFKNLEEPLKRQGLYESALCRMQSDWVIGINLTRLFTKLCDANISVGRVITPTLAMIVSRDLEIESFVKSLFYNPVLDLGESFKPTGKKYESKEEAEKAANECSGKDAIVTSIEKTKKKVQPPKLYDLTTLQREMNKHNGMNAADTLQCVQDLYEKKLVSYPRTDSRHITADMADKMSALYSSMNIGFEPDIKRLIGDVSDHHAIIITGISPEGVQFGTSKAKGHMEVYSRIKNRMIEAVASDHLYEAVSVKIECGNHEFKATGKTVIDEGWKGVLKEKDDEKDDTEQKIPELNKGDVFNNVRCFVKEGETKPKKRFTEDTLLGAMENAGSEDMPDDAERRGIGTPATRAEIINKLLSTKMIVRDNKNLISTQEGRVLIAKYIPDELKIAKLTAEWERKLKGIEKGEVNHKEFMIDICNLTKTLVERCKKIQVDKNDFNSLRGQKKREIIGKCMICGGEIYENKSGFFCTDQNCMFKLFKNNYYFVNRKKEITADMVKAFLKDGKAKCENLWSEEKKKHYNAVIGIEIEAGKFRFNVVEFY